MRPENIHSVYRIRFAVENEVSRIQSYGQIGQAYVANHTRHRCWGLLTGLHQEVLPIALAMLRHGANGLDRSWVKSIGWVFGNEAAVRLHLGDADEFGKVRHLAQRIDACGTRFWRYYANRGRAVRKGPLQGPRPAYFHCSGSHLILRKQILELGCQFLSETTTDVAIPGEKEVGKAEVMDSADIRLRGAEGADEQTQIHGLDCIGRQGSERCGGVERLRENGGGRNAQKRSAVDSRQIGIDF